MVSSPHCTNVKRKQLDGNRIQTQHSSGFYWNSYIAIVKVLGHKTWKRKLRNKKNHYFISTSTFFTSEKEL